MSQLRTTVVLLRFQLQAGSRIALRAMAPVAAGAVAAAVMYGSPMAVVVSHEFDLFAPFARSAVTVRDGSCPTVESLPPGTERLEILERMARGEG